ncbi:MAG: glycosyltransferase [Mycobacteriales bacterium]
MSTVVVDAAGAAMGGASRLLAELDTYVARSSRADVRVVGRQHTLRASWLLRRERSAATADRRIALNNVSFVAPGGERIVLLRNALHFPRAHEEPGLPPRAARRVAVEARAVRLAALRADLLVVPSTSMAERVARWLPSTRARTVVWPHPVSPRTSSGPREEGLVLCPVLMAPYKRMDHWLALLAAAARGLEVEGRRVRIEVTATAEELTAAGLGGSDLVGLGRLSVPEVERALNRAAVVYFPTTLESFGYPLAEARANGQPVLARDTAHNREVAGDALVPFDATTEDLARALARALGTTVPSTVASSADEYFGRLLGPVS